MCPASLPKVGAKVDIVGKGTATVVESQPAVQSGLYGSHSGAMPLPPGFDGGCTLQIQYADGTTDIVSAAEEPFPWSDGQTLGALGTMYLLIFATSEPGGSSGGSFDAMEERYEDELTGLGTPVPPDARPKEWSGEYWGASDESDAGDQAVRVHLRFEPDGRIKGHGRDDVDGSYRIRSGRWEALEDGRVKVAWKETYDEGFTAICMGTFDAASGKIDARFASSRNVSGFFSLAKKPSIF